MNDPSHDLFACTLLLRNVSAYILEVIKRVSHVEITKFTRGGLWGLAGSDWFIPIKS